MIDAQGGSNLRIRTKVKEVRNDGFTFSTESWSDSKTWSVKVTFIAVDVDQPPPGVAIGAVFFGGHPQQVCDASETVRSGRQLLESYVITMLSELDIQDGPNARLATSATLPEEGNFMLKAHTWDDSVTHGAKVTWFTAQRGGYEVEVAASSEGPLPGYEYVPVRDPQPGEPTAVQPRPSVTLPRPWQASRRTRQATSARATGA